MGLESPLRHHLQVGLASAGSRLEAAARGPEPAGRSRAISASGADEHRPIGSMLRVGIRV